MILALGCRTPDNFLTGHSWIPQVGTLGWPRYRVGLGRAIQLTDSGAPLFFEAIPTSEGGRVSESVAIIYAEPARRSTTRSGAGG